MKKLIQNRYFWFCFIGAFLFSSFPLLSSSVPETHDISFHLHRIEGMAEALKESQFPALIQPELNQGYGYAANTRYPRLFLYPAAIITAVGCPVVWSSQLLIGIKLYFISVPSGQHFYSGSFGGGFSVRLFPYFFGRTISCDGRE